MLALQDTDMVQVGHQVPALYNVWTGQIYVQGKRVCDIALQTTGYCSIPAQLSNTLEIKEVIRLSELRKKLPESIFTNTNFTGKEVCYGNIYYSTFQVITSNAVGSELEKLQKWMKENELAIIKILNDQGFLILMTSSVIKSCKDLSQSDSSCLKAVFLFPLSKSMSKREREEWKCKLTREEISLKITSLIPGLQYAIMETNRSCKERTLYPETLLEQYFKKFANLQKKKVCSTASKEHSKQASSILRIPQKTYENRIRERCSSLSFSRLKTYISDPVNFSVPVKKALSLLSEESSISEDKTKLNDKEAELIVYDLLESKLSLAAEIKIRNTTEKGDDREVKKVKGKSVHKSTTSASKGVENQSEYTNKRSLSGEQKNSACRTTVKLASAQCSHKRKRGAEVLTAEFVQDVQTKQRTDKGSSSKKSKRELRKTTASRRIPTKPSRKRAIVDRASVPDKNPKHKASEQAKKTALSETKTRSESLKKPLEQQSEKSARRSKRKMENVKKMFQKRVKLISKSEEKPMLDAKRFCSDGIPEETVLEKRISMYESHALNLLADLALNSFSSSNIPYLNTDSTVSEYKGLEEKDALEETMVKDYVYENRDHSEKACSSLMPYSDSLPTSSQEQEQTLKNEPCHHSSDSSKVNSCLVPSTESSAKQSVQKAHAAVSKAKSRHNNISKITLEHSYCQLPLDEITYDPVLNDTEAKTFTEPSIPSPIKDLMTEHQESTELLPADAILLTDKKGICPVVRKGPRDVSDYGEKNLQVTFNWDTKYDFDLDSKFTSDPLEKTINRALHGPWNTDLKEKVEDVQIILHMWLALFYSKSKKQLNCSSRKVVEHSNPAKYVSINTILDPSELYEIMESSMSHCTPDAQNSSIAVPSSNQGHTYSTGKLSMSTKPDIKLKKSLSKEDLNIFSNSASQDNEIKLENDVFQICKDKSESTVFSSSLQRSDLVQTGKDKTPAESNVKSTDTADPYIPIMCYISDPNQPGAMTRLNNKSEDCSYEKVSESEGLKKVSITNVKQQVTSEGNGTCRKDDAYSLNRNTSIMSPEVKEKAKTLESSNTHNRLDAEALSLQLAKKDKSGGENTHNAIVLALQNAGGSKGVRKKNEYAHTTESKTLLDTDVMPLHLVKKDMVRVDKKHEAMGLALQNTGGSKEVKRENEYSHKSASKKLLDTDVIPVQSVKKDMVRVEMKTEAIDLCLQKVNDREELGKASEHCHASDSKAQLDIDVLPVDVELAFQDFQGRKELGNTNELYNSNNKSENRLDAEILPLQFVKKDMQRTGECEAIDMALQNAEGRNELKKANESDLSSESKNQLDDGVLQPKKKELTAEKHKILETVLQSSGSRKELQKINEHTHDIGNKNLVDVAVLPSQHVKKDLLRGNDHHEATELVLQNTEGREETRKAKGYSLVSEISNELDVEVQPLENLRGAEEMFKDTDLPLKNAISSPLVCANQQSISKTPSIITNKVEDSSQTINDLNNVCPVETRANLEVFQSKSKDDNTPRSESSDKHLLIAPPVTAKAPETERAESDMAFNTNSSVECSDVSSAHQTLCDKKDCTSDDCESKTTDINMESSESEKIEDPETSERTALSYSERGESDLVINLDYKGNSDISDGMDFSSGTSTKAEIDMWMDSLTFTGPKENFGDLKETHSVDVEKQTITQDENLEATERVASNMAVTTESSTECSDLSSALQALRENKSCTSGETESKTTDNVTSSESMKTEYSEVSERPALSNSEREECDLNIDSEYSGSSADPDEMDFAFETDTKTDDSLCMDSERMEAIVQDEIYEVAKTEFKTQPVNLPHHDIAEGKRFDVATALKISLDENNHTKDVKSNNCKNMYQALKDCTKNTDTEQTQSDEIANVTETVYTDKAASVVDNSSISGKDNQINGIATEKPEIQIHTTNPCLSAECCNAGGHPPIVQTVDQVAKHSENNEVNTASLETGEHVGKEQYKLFKINDFEAAVLKEDVHPVCEHEQEEETRVCSEQDEGVVYGDKLAQTNEWDAVIDASPLSTSETHKDSIGVSFRNRHTNSVMVDGADNIEPVPMQNPPDICFITNTTSISEEQFNHWSEKSDDDIDFVQTCGDPIIFPINKGNRKTYSEHKQERSSFFQSTDFSHKPANIPQANYSKYFGRALDTHAILWERDEYFPRYHRDRDYYRPGRYGNVTVTKNLKETAKALQHTHKDSCCSGRLEQIHFIARRSITTSERTQSTLDLEHLRFIHRLKGVLRNASAEKLFCERPFRTMFESRKIPVCSSSTSKPRSPLLITMDCSYHKRNTRRQDRWYKDNCYSQRFCDDERSDRSICYHRNTKKYQTSRKSTPFHFGRLKYENRLEKTNSDISVIINECVQSNHLQLSRVCLDKTITDHSTARERSVECGVQSEAFGPDSQTSYVVKDIISDLCTSLHSRLNNVAKESDNKKFMFYITETSDDLFFSLVKGLLTQDGHTPEEPQHFCHSSDKESKKLFVVIRNEDICSHIHKIPSLLQLKLLPSVTFAGVDKPEDVMESTYQELFQAGGFVVSDQAVMEAIHLGKLRDVITVLKKMNETSSWKWLVHYRENRKLKEDKRTDSVSQTKVSLLKCYQQMNVIEVLPYHKCDSKEQSGDLQCILNLQNQRIHCRLAVYLTDKPDSVREEFERNGILVFDVDTFIRRIQKLDAQLQTSYW